MLTVPRRPLTRLIALCAALVLLLPAGAVAAADPRDFQLVNDTADTIYFVYVSPADAESWGEDVLGDEVLLAGESRTITFEGFFEDPETATCLYDIKVESADGQEAVLYDVDLCATSTVRIYTVYTR